VGTLFFAASLTPSLIPRTLLTQGVLSGIALGAGYGIGVLGHWLWSYLELPDPSPRTVRIVKLVAAAACAAIAAFFLWKTYGWQNSIRILMEMKPADSAHPLRIGMVALGVFGAVMIVSRMFSLTLLLILIPVLLVTTVLPPVIGLLLRPPLLHSLERAQALNVEITSVRAGWFSSDIDISMESNIFSADGLSPVRQSAILHLNHGPIMWHLYDTLFALTDIRLLPAPGQDQTNFSGSGLLRLDTRGYLHFDAITGFTAFAGDHWLETRASWPASRQGPRPSARRRGYWRPARPSRRCFQSWSAPRAAH
jgi:hypothetical protein